MIITCTNCNTSYELDENLIKETGSKVRCKNCSHVFTVYPPRKLESIEPEPDLELEILADEPQQPGADEEPSAEMKPDSEEVEDTESLNFPDLESMLEEETEAETESMEFAEDEAELSLEMDGDEETAISASPSEGGDMDYLDLSDIEDMLMSDAEAEPDKLKATDDEPELSLETTAETKDEESFAETTAETEDEESFAETTEKSSDSLDLSEIEEMLELEKDVTIKDLEQTGEEQDLELADETQFDPFTGVAEDLLPDDTDSLDLSDIEKMLDAEVDTGTESVKITEEEPELSLETESEGAEIPDSSSQESGDGLEPDMDLDLELETEEETAEKSDEISETLTFEEDLSLEEEPVSNEEPSSDQEESEDLELETELDESDLKLDVDEIQDLDLELEESESEVEKEEVLALEPEKASAAEEDLDWESDTDEDLLLELDEDSLEIDLEESETEETDEVDFELDLDEIEEDVENIEETESAESEASAEESVPAETFALGADEQSETGDQATPQAPTTHTTPRPKKKSRALTYVLVILLLICGGVYGALIYLEKQGIELRELPYINTFFAETGEVVAIETTLNYEFYENAQAGSLLVITGEVENQFDHARSEIRVTGEVLSGDQKVLKTETVYCGNLLKPSVLENESFDLIKQQLKKTPNLNVQAGARASFMVAFRNLPENVKEFRVTMAGSNKAGK